MHSDITLNYLIPPSWKSADADLLWSCSHGDPLSIHLSIYADLEFEINGVSFGEDDVRILDYAYGMIHMVIELSLFCDEAVYSFPGDSSRKISMKKDGASLEIVDSEIQSRKVTCEFHEFSRIIGKFYLSLLNDLFHYFPELMDNEEFLASHIKARDIVRKIRTQNNKNAKTK